MINPITSNVIKYVPYVGPLIQGVGIALYTKEIIESYTPLGTVKIIASKFVKKCTTPEIFIAGNCVMLIGGMVASVSTTGNCLVVSKTMSRA